MLLQRLPGHVEREVVRVHNAAHKAEVVEHHVLEVVGDEDPARLMFAFLPDPYLLNSSLCWLLGTNRLA